MAEVVESRGVRVGPTRECERFMMLDVDNWDGTLLPRNDFSRASAGKQYRGLRTSSRGAVSLSAR
jgi:hypothetical protein